MNRAPLRRRGAWLLATAAALPLAAPPASAQQPGDPDGGPHVAVALGPLGVDAGPGFGRCCVDAGQLDLRVGWWLRGDLRIEGVVGANALFSPDHVDLPPFVAPPAALGPDTIRIRQHPRQLGEPGAALSTGVRAVREVRSEAGFALRFFAGGRWYWAARVPLLSVGAGLRFGPQRFGVGLDYSRDAVPVPYRDTEWRYMDGGLVETAREDGRDWAFPWSLLVSLEVNP